MSPLPGQAGQTAAEYMGLLLVVGVVIAAIAASDIAGTVSDAIARQVCRVASDGPCEPAGDAQRAGRPDGRERPGSGDRAPAEATGLSLGPARVVSGAPARAVTLRPAVADGDAETCFASTTGDCGPTPDGAYELVPPEPSPGEQVDGFLSDLGGDADAWLGWLGGSDPSSPFYDPLAQQRRDDRLETFDDGLAFLEGLNQGPSALGPPGPTNDSGGELANELMGISPLRRAIAGAQEGDDLRSLGELAVLFPFFRGARATREGLEEATEEGAEQAGRQGAREGVEGARAARPRGQFSVRRWEGYPDEVPKPAGDLRLRTGTEYEQARAAANRTNRRLRREDPNAYRGKQIHEIHPVKFGGSPTDPANKIAVTPEEHYRLNAFWLKQQRNAERPR